MSLQGKKALVTGGGGFIGSHLVRGVLDQGATVRVLDNFATGKRENLDGVLGDIELVEGDIQSYERVHTAVRSCDVVFHQAALPSVPRSIQDPLTSNASNVIGTLNVLLAARDEAVDRVVFASSSSLYGANRALPKREDMATLPIAPYGVAKLAAEGYCRSFTQVYGLETVALRYFNVFGPGQDPLSAYAAVIPRFITDALAGERPTIYGDGEQTRDFTYVENAVSATMLAAGADGASGQVFNVACGERTSLNQVLGHVSELLGTTIEPEYREGRPGDVRDSLADISRAIEVLGYNPLVHIEEGLRRTLEHHQAAAQAP